MLLDAVASALRTRVTPHQSVVVGLSGGVDSVVLLHALWQLQAQELVPPFKLSALHVHHGLQSEADQWVEFCQQLCLDLAVPLQVARVSVFQQKQEGVEAAARRARYQAFTEPQADWLLLAHHAKDQAETFLMRLLRGAHAHGLGAIRAVAPIKDSHTRILRPLLACSREQILEYAQRYQLAWVTDPSNANPQLTRGYLRGRVLPLLADYYPGVEKVLVRTASHMQDVATLLDEVAAQDNAKVACDSGAAWRIDALLALSDSRICNLWAWHFRRRGEYAPGSEVLAELLRQLRQSGLKPLCVAVGKLQLTSYRGKVSFSEVLRQASVERVSLDEAIRSGVNFEVHVGAIVVKGIIGAGRGIPLLYMQSLLEQGAEVALHQRQGGEGVVLQGGGFKTLKKLLQEKGIPEWQRASLWLCSLTYKQRVEVLWGEGLGYQRRCFPCEKGIELLVLYQ